MELNKSYYAILPAIVRYDKDLSPNAKLLYSEITCLCNEKGYCWATNSYFSQLYNLSERTIQRILEQLSKKKYIIIKIENNTSRKIYLTTITPDKNVGGGTTKMSYPYDKNVTHNNKKNNINEIIKKESIDLEEFNNINWLEL